MKRGEAIATAGGALLGYAGWRLIPAIFCWLRRHHLPVRHPLGGFRCVDCGHSGRDLEQMGFVGGAYVPPLRTTFSRDGGGGRGETTRTSEPVDGGQP